MRLIGSSAHSWRLRGIAALVLSALMLAMTGGGVAAGGHRGHGHQGAADPKVINDWNAIAVRTIAVEAGKANAEAFLWYGFTQVAVHNAVNGITHRYELYKWHAHESHRASPQAAAAAAAHAVLAYYFPLSKANLDADLATSLLAIPDGWAKTRGVEFGERAAARLIQLRVDDGRNTPLIFNQPLMAGVWRPTPPAFAPFLAPWLSVVRPLTLRSTQQFRPSGPPALTSETYTKEYNEVKDYGSAGSVLRSPAQTETAKFFSDIAIGPLQGSLRDLATRHHFDISKRARMFAAVDVSIADALGAIWDSKFHFGFWRPITAIQLGDIDTNPDTVGDAAWLPLIVTPPYPDYASGLSAVVGAMSRALTRVLGTRHIDLNITSVAAGLPGTPLTRHYELAADFNQDVIDARVWSGIHFRTADVVGNRIGKKVADWALDHYFERTGKHGEHD